MQEFASPFLYSNFENELSGNLYLMATGLL